MRVIYILWLRQIKRHFRTRSRLIGAIGQPLLFLLALGYGLGSVFQRAGQGNYMQFLVPGVIGQTVLFSAVFFGINVIFDRQFGFLKETLVAPVSRLKIMLGSALGGATVSVFQGLVVFGVAYILGFRPYDWALVPVALFICMLLALALTSFSSGVGAIVNDFQGFQSINQFLIFPLFFLSGALYPLNNAPPALTVLAAINPISYAIDALRATLLNQSHYGLGLDLLVLCAVMAALVLFAINRFKHIEA
jgi:ABC-2 type transport system permease protein